MAAAQAESGRTAIMVSEAGGLFCRGPNYTSGRLNREVLKLAAATTNLIAWPRWKLAWRPAKARTTHTTLGNVTFALAFQLFAQ